MKKNAMSVYYPDSDTPTRYEVELSESGCKKGMIIGGIIGSKIPIPWAIPSGIIIGGLLGSVFGKAD